MNKSTNAQSLKTKYCKDFPGLFLEDVFAKLDEILKKGSVKIAVDGHSASGKTTLAQILQDVYGCTVFHMDDYFLRPEQRTPERLSKPGENVDHERFLQEVLLPLQSQNSVTYRRFDCSEMKLKEEQTVNIKNFVVVEGAYSMHPLLCKYYDFCIFLDVDSDLQKERILKRNTSKQAKMFFERWIPLENAYFIQFNIKEKADMVISVK